MTLTFPGLSLSVLVLCSLCLRSMVSIKNKEHEKIINTCRMPRSTPRTEFLHNYKEDAEVVVIIFLCHHGNKQGCLLFHCVNAIMQPISRHSSKFMPCSSVSINWWFNFVNCKVLFDAVWNKREDKALYPYKMLYPLEFFKKHETLRGGGTPSQDLSPICSCLALMRTPWPLKAVN